MGPELTYPSAPPWLAPLPSAAGLVVSGALVTTSAILRLRERAVPGWFGPMAALSFGAGSTVSLFVVPVNDARGELVASLWILGLMPALLAFSRRFDLAGLVLMGMGLPPLLWWGSFAVQEVLAPGFDNEDGLLAWLGGAVAVVVVGLVATAIGDRSPRPTVPPPDEPDPGRAVSIATAVMRDLRFGPFDLPNSIAVGLAIVGATVVSIALGAAGVDGLVTTVVGAGVLALLATEVFYHAWPRRLELAMATHAFLGSWETRRFVATTGTKTPTSVAAARRWLERNPETDANRWVYPEMLAWVGRFDEAYAVLERLPAATEEQRFERHSIRVFLDLVAGRPADVDGLAAAAESVGAPGSDERLRAIAAAAVAESRRRLAFREADWAAPMVGAQERIGRRSLSIQRADTWLQRLRMVALTIGVIAIVGTVLGVVGA